MSDTLPAIEAIAHAIVDAANKIKEAHASAAHHVRILEIRSSLLDAQATLASHIPAVFEENTAEVAEAALASFAEQIALLHQTSGLDE